MSRFPKLFRAAVLSTALIAIANLGGTLACAQDSQQPGGFTAADYAGTWHWMFQGKPFATMIIQQNGEGFTGSVTNGSIDVDENGKITSAAPLEGTSAIVRASMADGVLQIVTKQGDDEIEVAFKLTSATTGELRFVGSGPPPNAEPVQIMKEK